MSPKLRFYIPAILILILLNFTCRRGHAQETTEKQDAPANVPKMFGQFTLTTNYIDKGVSLSNNSFAMQLDGGYRWATGQIGIWGSNVQFPATNGENLNLRIYGWYSIVFTADSDLKIRLETSKFTPSNVRNTDIVTFDLNMESHHVIIQSDPNWFGCSNTWLGYQKIWPAFWNLDYNLRTGYNMLSNGPLGSYFDVRTGFGFKYQDIYYELLMNYNSGGGQFPGGTGALAVFMQLSARF
jgi:hypothetical protein